MAKADLFVRVHGQVPYRNPRRIPYMMQLMEAVWALDGWTDMRMGQLLSAAASRGGWKQPDIFHCEEEVFAAGFLAILAEASNVKS